MGEEIGVLAHSGVQGDQLLGALGSLSDVNSGQLVSWAHGLPWYVCAARDLLLGLSLGTTW